MTTVDGEEARRGYKQTDVGVIPEEWRVSPLGSHVRITSGESPSLFRFTTSGIPYFKVEQLGNTDKYLGSGSTPYHFLAGKTVPRQSVVFAKRGAAISLNKIRVLIDDSFMDTNVMALTPADGLDVEYLYYKLGHIGLWQFADTTSVPQINNKHVQPLPFPLPKLTEQRAISAALSDVDALLAGLDRLITKKRDLKQAAMQQLLTGQTRLPGFRGQWAVKRLGDCLLGPPEYGINAPSVAYLDRLPTYIRITDISEDGRFQPAPLVSVQSAIAGKYLLNAGDLVFARTGASVGKSYRYVSEDGQLVFAGFLIRVRPNPNLLLSSFLAAYATTKSYWNWVTLMSMRSGQPGINGGEYATLPIRLPPVEEQDAISEVLADMGAEVSALEVRRDKTRDLKQAMMQELLTGRIRLVSTNRHPATRHWSPTSGS